MSLIKNKDTGNFYPTYIPNTDWRCDWLFSTHRGCPHDCVYCSSKKLNNRFKSLGDPTVPRRLKGEYDYGGLKRKNFPDGTIFVNPYCDTFTLDVTNEINPLLWLCNQNPQNTFVFQTKDTFHYLSFNEEDERHNQIPSRSWLGTTIETDDTVLYKELGISNAPIPANRLHNLVYLKQRSKKEFRFFVTIEPVMKFSGRLLFWLKELQPNLVFIGANTSKVQLPEPTNDELIEFIYALYDTIGIEKVYLKSNVRRLIPDFYDGWKLAEKQNMEVNNG